MQTAHNRQSTRLKEFNYSDPGYYFVTFCTQERECIFGTINKHENHLNQIGQMAKYWWNELINKFKTIRLDDYIIMPNHIHGIIEIVGADPCVDPANVNQGTCVGSAFMNSNAYTGSENPMQVGGHIGPPLPQMVQWFKTMATNEYIRNVKQSGWPPFNKRLFQRNYYDHIIRDENDLNRIREYIRTNPEQWEHDQNNLKRTA